MRSVFVPLLAVGLFGAACATTPARDELTSASVTSTTSAEAATATATASALAPASAAPSASAADVPPSTSADALGGAQLLQLGSLSDDETAQDPAMRRALAVRRAMAKEVRPCIKASPGEVKPMKGTVVVVLAPDGSVTTSKAEGFPAPFAACLEPALRKLRFDPAAGEPQRVAMPLTINPQ